MERERSKDSNVWNYPVRISRTRSRTRSAGRAPELFPGGFGKLEGRLRFGGPPRIPKTFRSDISRDHDHGHDAICHGFVHIDLFGPYEFLSSDRLSSRCIHGLRAYRPRGAPGYAAV